MAQYGTIMVVDDNPAILTAAKITLQPHFENVITLSSPKDIISTLNQEEVWIYLEESYGLSSINFLRQSEYYFSIADNGRVIENIATVKGRFDRCIKEIKEG